MNSQNTLTDAEIAFCELYINGTAPYAGNPAKCYQDVFPEKATKGRGAAIRLLNQPHIKEYIEQLGALNDFDAKRKREYLARHLENIIEETSTVEYSDRRGVKMSPAALRSVCVQAMKLYAELYPVKDAQTSKNNSENNGGGGITFNVIIPNQTPEKGDKE